MIQYIKRKDIDIVKYDSCIQSSINSRIYAHSWFLDIVADNWDVLVYNDYEAVLPIPWRSKYLIKYIYPPCWTQQLGVFSSKIIDDDLLQTFIESIPSKFKKITIHFNSSTVFSSDKTLKKRNYILPLKNSYLKTKEGFNQNRKRELKKTTDFNIEKEISAKEFLDFYLKLPKNYDLDKRQIETLTSLLNSQNRHVYIWGIKKENKIEAALVWLKDDSRITYLVPAATKEAKKHSFPTFIISELIREHSNTNLILDFEGSMIEGVAKFYKSFGANIETYVSFQQSPFS